MKITLLVELDGGLVVPILAEVNKLSDVGKLGRKLAALPRGANRLFPDIADRKVIKLRFAKE